MKEIKLFLKEDIMKISDTMVLALLKKGLAVEGENIDMDMDMNFDLGFAGEPMPMNVKMKVKIGSYKIENNVEVS